MRRGFSLLPILFAALLLLLAGGAGALLLVLFRPFDSRTQFFSDPPAVVQEIQRLNELVTVRYNIQKVIGIKEQKQPFGSESLLLIVQARVLGGVDLSSLREGDIQMNNSAVMVRLPSAQILGVQLDEKETRVWDRQITWWTPWVPYNADLERQARLKALDAVRDTALHMGILANARKNAENTISSLLKVMGATTVTFESSPKS